MPQDIALAGFDDIPTARFVVPALTTVRVRIADLGRRAFERLAELIAAGDDGAKTTERLDCELVVRQSSGAHDAARSASGADTS